MARVIDLTGKRFGRLVVLRRVQNKKHGKGHVPAWYCLCDCGNATIVAGAHLRDGKTRSCWCLRGEKHGKHGSRIYRIWRGMIQRCETPQNASYKNYALRGITVCQKWRESFSAFYADMGDCPSGYELDRIDNSLGYFVENCRWVTRRSNQRNKRTNHLLTIGDKTFCITEWAEISSIGKELIRYRIKQGWSIERAVFEPVKGKSNAWKNSIAISESTS